MRIGAVVAAAAGALMLQPGAAPAAPTVGGCGVFPDYAGPVGARSAADQTAWNQVVSDSPKDPRSREYMRKIRSLPGNQALHPDFGGGGEYGIPFTAVPQGEPLVNVTIGPGGYPGESEFGAGTTGPPSAPIPLTAPIEGGPSGDGDRHVLVVREGECDLWEMYRSFPRPGQGEWEADSTALFDLGSAELHPGTWTSADAAGLAILPGLVRYDEVEAGTVSHALRATFSRTRKAYINPAVHHASSRCNAALPPMGLRLRMKESYYLDHLGSYEPQSQARPIFQALHEYGMIVADNGSNWYFQGDANPGWDDGELNQLKGVPGRAFQVVDSAAAVSTRC